MRKTEVTSGVASALKKRGWMVATAESCTGGLVAKWLTDQGGSSEYFAGGAVVYTNRSKTRVLGVPADTVQREGAVSRSVVESMCDGACRLYECECSVAISGVAGPSGGTKDKPVGTVWICARARLQSDSRRFVFDGNRADIRKKSAVAALRMLTALLSEEELPALPEQQSG